LQYAMHSVDMAEGDLAHAAQIQDSFCQSCENLVDSDIFFFNLPAPTDIYTLSLHDALPISECLIQLTKLGYDATPFNQILKQNAKREMRLRLGKVTVADVLAAQPVTTNLLKFMRASIKMIGVSNLQSFIASMTQK